jgi:signal transduction histidine kinase
MTIQSRILAGHLAVALLLLVPAIYAIGRLGVVAKQTRESLQLGLDRLYTLDQFRSEFESVVLLKRSLRALEDPSVPTGGPDVREKAEASLVTLRRIYRRARPHFETKGDSAALTHLDSMMASAMPEALSDQPLETAPAGPVSDADIVWTDADVEQARSEIDSTYDDARRRMMGETVATEVEAEQAARLSLIGLCIAVPLAIGSTFLAVRGMQGPLNRLMSATRAVSAGKFGVAVPVKGHDEMSHLTEAFNKMTESLAALEAMKADFLSVASHELKTPLTCIKGYAGALRASLPPGAEASPDVARYLDRIDREADLLARKVSELLTFGMIEAGQLQLERREIITEGFLMMVGEAFKPIAADRKIAFKVDVGEVPPRFFGDPDRMNQVLLNLLDNAFKYTPSGGEVELKGRGKDDMLEVAVSDTGPGIPESQASMIFEKYARLRSSSDGGRGGTGLGLAVARGIVLAHGGTIGVNSSPGRGSQFVVRLPVNPAGEPAAREVA